MTKRSILKQIIVFLIPCLVISNILWYLGYSDQTSDNSMMFVMLAGFLPAALALIITKVTKEGWNNLGIAFNIKNGWKMYLLSIIGTTAMAYLADPLMLLIFSEEVSTTFTLPQIKDVALAMLIGTACLIECLGEELGWIGYLFPRLERMMGTIPACAVIGTIRAVWHIGILFFIEYPVVSFIELMLSNIFLQLFMIYMFKKSGSLFPCSISHGISNLLPIFLVYESKWYYTSVVPMVISMLPALIFAALGFLGLKRNGLIEKPSVIQSDNSDPT